MFGSESIVDRDNGAVGVDRHDPAHAVVAVEVAGHPSATVEVHDRRLRTERAVSTVHPDGNIACRTFDRSIGYVNAIGGRHSERCGVEGALRILSTCSDRRSIPVLAPTASIR